MPEIAPRKRLENVHPAMAKADLNFLEPDWREQVGQAIERAFSLVGWSQKEAAAKLDRDPAQIARWLAGTERPQFDVLFGLDELRQPLVMALAELTQAEVVTEIRFSRRSA